MLASKGRPRRQVVTRFPVAGPAFRSIGRTAPGAASHSSERAEAPGARRLILLRGRRGQRRGRVPVASRIDHRCRRLDRCEIQLVPVLISSRTGAVVRGGAVSGPAGLLIHQPDRRTVRSASRALAARLEVGSMSQFRQIATPGRTGDMGEDQTRAGREPVARLAGRASAAPLLHRPGAETARARAPALRALLRRAHGGTCIRLRGGCGAPSGLRRDSERRSRRTLVTLEKP
jgi:hypothetical protein